MMRRDVEKRVGHFSYIFVARRQNRMTLIKSQLGHWYVKECQQDLIYIVATSPSCPMDIASECLDELYELHQQAMGTFRPQKRKQAEDASLPSNMERSMRKSVSPRKVYEINGIKEQMNNNTLALLKWRKLRGEDEDIFYFKPNRQCHMSANL
jgi:hypothetical protein